MKFERKFPKTKKVRFNLLAGDCLPVGCALKDGKLLPALSAGEGLESNVPEGPVFFADYSPLNKKYLVCAGNYIYISTDGVDFSSKKKFTIDDVPTMHELSWIKTTASVVLGNTTNYFFNSTTGITESYTGNIRSSVMKNGRFFGIDRSNPYKIRWSGDSYHEWTENIDTAGWVLVGYGYGKIQNLVIFKEEIIAVREYGLTKLNAFGTPENFKLEYLDRITSKIYVNTAAVAGDYLIFYTEDGLYCFDGSKIKKVNLPLCGDLMEPWTADALDDKYLLCGTSKSLKRKVILQADLAANYICLIDVAADAVMVGENVYAYAGGKAYPLKTGAPYALYINKVDLSVQKNKFIKELVLSCEGEVEIEVSNGVKSRILRGVSGKIPVNMGGKIFNFCIKADKQINGLYAVAEVVDEV